jgi:predicted transglutaminase-like cysteine proteinase
MARFALSMLCAIVAVALLLPGGAEARSRGNLHDVTFQARISDGSPTLAPFQHVRFCLRYPSECKSDPTEKERIELTAENIDLLRRVNQDVNGSIAPINKSYGTDLQDGWSIAPSIGDCNDYAVTKRHELLASGVPAKALRLSVVKTASGLGHLVLVVATTRGDLVMDNLTEAIRSWQNTDYHWLKIQSAADARYWFEVDQRIRLAKSTDRIRQ